MILKTYEAANFTIQRNFWLNELRTEMEDVRKRAIRQEFDESLIDSKAQACIDVAKELGFTDLATEMENDLQTELLTA